MSSRFSSYGDQFKSWLDRVFSDPQVFILALLLVLGCVLIVLLSDILMPVFAAGVIAYLLDGVIGLLARLKIPRLPTVLIVFGLFLTLVTFILLALVPLLYQQTVQLVDQFPQLFNRAQEAIIQLPEHYPHFVSAEQIDEILSAVRTQTFTYTQDILSMSAASLIGLISMVVYLVLVPLLVFFFLKDKDRIMRWLMHYLPGDRRLVRQVWRQVDKQIGNYIRGKFLELALLGVASFISFYLLGLNYSLLLAVAMGLSVLIPYVGATVVTIPVVVVAYLQWGINTQFWYVMIAYTIVQVIDGTILVPVLFSEVVDLHPVAIIVAILFFGGLWGFWGVFFAIPLAILVQAVLSVNPKVRTTL
ncbi:MAG TPA: AI-2E family transporter [Crenotrichaceae bacterium]|nr:AI-2E family transporter [Crenotrichaceae bacterium]